MRFKLLVFLLIVAAVLAACGNATTTPTAEPQTDDTTEEAGDATTTEEAEGGDEDGGDSADLPESFSGATAASGTLSVNYPSGYTQAGSADSLILTNTTTATGITVTVSPAAAVTGSTPAEILESYSTTLAASGVTFSDPEEMTFGSNSGAIIEGTASGAQTIIAVVAVNDAYVFLTLSGAESADNRATLEAVASSVTLE